jgi:hypothetical protein
MTMGTDKDLGASGWEQDGGVFAAIASGARFCAQTVLPGVARLLREQPVLAGALAAAVAGAVVGTALAEWTRPASPVERASRLARRAKTRAAEAASASRRGALSGFTRKVSAVPDLVPPLMSLLGNPIVQSMIRRAIVNAVARRFERGR